MTIENATVKNILDGLTSRGVLSADGRRQVFAILLEQSTGYEQKISLLEGDLKRVRASRDALAAKK